MIVAMWRREGNGGGNGGMDVLTVAALRNVGEGRDVGWVISLLWKIVYAL